jgi:HK97 family phage portal protein
VLLLDRLAWARDVLTSDTTVTVPAVSGDVVQVASLPQEVAQAFGINTDLDSVTRKQAMSIPAVRQGRNVIAGKIGTAPLLCTRTRAGKAPERVPRPFFDQPDPNTTRVATLTWTIDDLLFYGVSYWVVTERDAQSFPAHAVRVDPWRVRLDYRNQRIYVDGKPLSPRDVIGFQGPDEGLLRAASRTLKTSLLLEEAVRRFAVMEVPVGLFEDEEDSMEPDEIDEFLSSWEAHRKARTTGYVPKGLKYSNPSVDAQKMQLQEARAFQSAEIARHMNLPAYAVNAPTSDSLTYATTEGNRRDLVEITYASYVAAVEQRLSMGDVTPAGTVVHLDFTAFIRGDLKTVIETGALAVDKKIMTVDEVRVDWLNLPPLNQEDTNGQE